MNGVGCYAAILGRHAEARDTLEGALALAREADDFGTEANVLDSLGYLFTRTGEHQRAIRHYQRATMLAHELGDVAVEAKTEERLGDSYAAMDNHEEARRHWQAALHMYRSQQRMSDSDRVLVHLQVPRT